MQPALHYYCGHLLTVYNILVILSGTASNVRFLGYHKAILFPSAK